MQHKVNFPKGELMIYHLVSYKPQPIEVKHDHTNQRHSSKSQNLTFAR